MALTASGLFLPTFRDLWQNDQAIDYVADVIKAMLLDNTGTPNFDTHDFIADLNAGEVNATGYTAGGGTLDNCAVDIATTSGTVYLDCDDEVWTITGTLTAHGALIYDDTITNDPLIALLWFGGAVTATDDTFTLAIPTNGWASFDLTP